MAARSTKELTEQWKSKIQSSLLINRLNEHAKGKKDMTSTQIKAAEILLKKVMPDMKHIEGQVDANITVIINKPE